MRICTYNIQYGLGKDGDVDVARIAGETGDADVICLQEVEQHFPETAMIDQPAAIAESLPHHHWVFGPGVDINADVVDDNGLVRHRRRRFGNMVLARSPILSSSVHLLPKHDLLDQFSLQRCALETVIDTNSGPLRVITTHLSHTSPLERADQIEALLDIVFAGTGNNGVWSGGTLPSHWVETGAPPPRPRRTLVTGDFNLTPDSAEYELLVGAYDIGHGRLATERHLIDCWISTNSGDPFQPTCIEEPRGERPRRSVRLDYLFATPDIATSITSMTVDEGAQGSDHQPVFADAEI